jgi:hypothetical protein
VGAEPLRQLGEHKIVVRLSGDFQPEFTVVIESDEEEPQVLFETEEMAEAQMAEIEFEPEVEETAAQVAEDESDVADDNGAEDDSESDAEDA